MSSGQDALVRRGGASHGMASGSERWGAVYAMIMLANPGATTGTITPVIVDAFVAHGRVTLSEAVGLGAAQMAGMGLALLGTALLIKRLNRRMTAALALFIACIANLWSSSSADFPLLLALRVLVGAGTGVCYSIAVVSIVASANVARNFGYSVAANQISGILLLTILPALTIWGGVPAAMVTLAIFTLFCGVTLSWLPAHAIAPTEERQGASSSVIRSAPPIAALRGLLSMFLLAAAFGACWPIVGRIAVAGHVTNSEIVTGFALAGYGGVVGGFVSAFLGPRLSKRLILILGSTGFAASLLLQVVPHVSFALAAIALMFFCTFNIPNYLSLVAEIDGSGRLAIVMTALMQLGMAAGQAAVAAAGKGVSFVDVAVAATAMAILACLLVLNIRVAPRS
jgi:predicted MFS family arabinose efflux permease